MDVSKVLSNTTRSKDYEKYYADLLTSLGPIGPNGSFFETAHEPYYTGSVSIFIPNDPDEPLVETVKASNRTHRQTLARQFWRGGCTFDSVHKTCVLPSGGIFSWPDSSYAITWVAVHGVDDSICVVTRHNDLDVTRLCGFYKTSRKHDAMYALTESIVSDVDSLPYDDEFCKRAGQSINKPFGVVCVIPVTEKSREEVTGQLAASSVEYDKNKAINFLMEKMKSEPAITLDEAVKTAISAFQHLCLQKLEAEEFWVTSFEGHGVAAHLTVPTIEKHLAVINSRAGNGDSGSDGGSTNMKMEELLERLNNISFY